VLTHTLKVVKNVPDILHLKLAAFFHDIAKPITYSKDKQGVGHFYGHHKKGAEITRVILLRLKYDNFTIERVTKLVLYHDAVIELNENIIKRWLNKLSEEVLRELIILKKADTLALNPQYYFRLNEFDKITGLIDKVIIQEQCFSLKNLAVNGYDILKLGIPQNKLIGQILDYLLCNVIDGIFPNDEKILKNEAYKYYNSLSKN
jgi:tRNA nucleotidyltransferase (CCA-adding enzyme)